MTIFTPRDHDDRSISELLHRASEPVIVESYHGGWDEPWRVLDTDGWETVRRGLSGNVRCAMVETSSNREIALRYGLEILPELLVFLDNEVVARFRSGVDPQRVVEAVRVALHERRIRDEALGELEGVTAARETLSPVRSVMRSRGGVAVPSLSRAG